MGLISRVSSRTYRLKQMVTFSCGTCNESLKKQKVEQHYFRCRNDYVTCIDCNSDFFGDDFSSHTKCVSEAQKVLGIVGANENIPRKKKKFDNFIRNTCRFASQAVIDEIWEAINVKKPEPVKPEPVKSEPADTETPSIPEQNNNKRKAEEADSGTCSSKKWKWSKEIKATIRACDKAELKIKSLRKLCFAKAESAGVDPIEKEEFLNKVKKVK